MNQRICPPIDCVQATICKTTKQHIIGTAKQLTELLNWKWWSIEAIYITLHLLIPGDLFTDLCSFTLLFRQTTVCWFLNSSSSTSVGSFSCYLVLTTYFLRYYRKWIVVTKHTMLMICILWFHFTFSRQISVASCHYMSYWFINLSDIWIFLNCVMTNGPAYM